MYIYYSQYTDAGWAREIKKKLGLAVSAVCHGNLSACHFGHMCHRFPSPVTRILHHQDEKVPLHLSLYSSTGFQDIEDRDNQGVLVSYTAELTEAGLEQLILLSEYLVILMMNVLTLL